jgi:hypothetical protein
MNDLSTIELRDPDGATVRLGDIIDRPTVIDLVRYYGCAPCRKMLNDLSGEYGRITQRGGDVIGVGPRAAYQATALRRDGAVPFELLLDPDHHLARAIELGRQSLLRFIFDVKAWRRWLRAARTTRQGLITGGWWEVPAIVVVDSSCRVSWVHRGTSIGDYPPLSSVLEALEDAIGKDRDPDRG